MSRVMAYVHAVVENSARYLYGACRCTSNLKVQYSCYKFFCCIQSQAANWPASPVCTSFNQVCCSSAWCTGKEYVVYLSVWHSSLPKVYCHSQEYVNVRERHCYLRHFEMYVMVNLGCFRVNRYKHFTPFWWVFVGLLLCMCILLKALFMVGCYCSQPGWLSFMLIYVIHFCACLCTCTILSQHFNLLTAIPVCCGFLTFRLSALPISHTNMSYGTQHV
jgi:hypothetical protein